MSTDCQNPTGCDHTMHALNEEFVHLPLDHDSRSHHLLKHCLSNGQRNEALRHFSSFDVKEVAKEISRMGQRELQAKFKLVYGTGTHSNNNDWLRRKLFEAVGAAPVKAGTKPRPRKPAAKPRKALDPDGLYHASFSGVNGLQERRSRRTPKGTPKGMALAKAIYRSRSSYHQPSSPLGGASVLDLHAHLSNDSTTGSDDESWEDEMDGTTEERNHHSGSDVDGSDTPRSAFMPVSGGMGPMTMGRPPLPPAVQGGRPLQMTATYNSSMSSFSRASSSNLLRLHSLNFDVLQSSEQWATDSWADIVLGSAPSAQLAPMQAEEDDVPLLQFDTAQFNTTADILL